MSVEEIFAAEAESIRVVVSKYLASRPNRRIAPFHYDWGQRLHREMFGKVWSWAGALRQQDMNFGIPHRQVPERLIALFADVAHWTTLGQSIEEQTFRVHLNAVSIHPFHDGNGRWARVLANIWSARQAGWYVEWPSEVGIVASSARESYIAAIKAALRGDSAPLMELHARFRRDY